MTTSPTVVWSIMAAVMFVLGSAAVLLRFLAIHLRSSMPKTYDYLILLAYFGLIIEVVCVSLFGIARGGYGIHVNELTLEEIENSLKGLFVQQWIWSTSITAFRLAILLLYREIFSAKVVRYGSMILIILVVVNEIQCIVVDLVLCRPIQASWDITLDRHCGNILTAEISSAVISMIIDILVTFLPLPVIWQLQLSKQKKWVLTSAFSVGTCVAGVNLGRLIWNLTCPESDNTFCLLNSTIFVLSEISLGLVVATVPTLGPIYHTLGEKWVSIASSKPSVIEERSQKNFPPTVGSISLRPQKKRGLYNDESLLRSQPDVELGSSDWPSQHIVPQALSEDHGSTVPQSMGYRWRTETNGDTASHSVCDRKGQVVGGVPHSGIIRDVEYDVHEWQQSHGKD
ncbi:uncharacterized protein GGS22DRAFT_161723 [Annulohypoxylon maeteangense]|uniref:uncharacterized protein n=1 Tax=Annulohypoxylon maeteangense TaxID=1927788 RepID=UPI0020086336|nr:uncharacterized protein GGS22DRAFT_161723 [Annulohypoxylon maeteangense]KAI0885724.1 hypothetical protein GGS22DRAFT_161723 [Annulohypoxylon maeteangense]